MLKLMVSMKIRVTPAPAAGAENGDEMNVDADGVNGNEMNLVPDGLISDHGNPLPAAGDMSEGGENSVELNGEGVVHVDQSHLPESVSNANDLNDVGHVSVASGVNAAHSLDVSQSVVPSNASGKLFDEAGSDANLDLNSVKESTLTDDDDDFEDASDDAGAEIGSFSSPPPSSSPIIDSFSDESQSILANVAGADVEESYNADDESAMDLSCHTRKHKTASDDSISVSLRGPKPSPNKVRIFKSG